MFPPPFSLIVALVCPVSTDPLQVGFSALAVSPSSSH
jgi:hypothetical protein